jgi:hypothetical protein
MTQGMICGISRSITRAVAGLLAAATLYGNSTHRGGAGRRAEAPGLFEPVKHRLRLRIAGQLAMRFAVSYAALHTERRLAREGSSGRWRVPVPN